LWVYQACNVVNQALLEELLASKDHRIRAAAVRVAAGWVNRLDADAALASRNESGGGELATSRAASATNASSPVSAAVSISTAKAASDPAALTGLTRSQIRALGYFATAVADSHPRVRLEAVRALARIPHAMAAETAMVALDQPLDRWLDFAAWQTMRDLQAHWLPAVQRGELDFAGRVDRLTFALRAADSPEIARPLLELVRAGKIPASRLTPVLTLIASVGNGAELQELLKLVASNDSGLDPAQRATTLSAITQEAPRRKVVPAGGIEMLTHLLNDSDMTLRAAAVQAAGTWKRDEHRTALERAAREDDAENVRLAALQALGELGGETAIAVLVERAETASLSERQQAVASLARLAPRKSAQAAVKLLAQSDLDPARVVGELLARREGPASLIAALETAQLPPDVARLLLRAAQATGKPSPELLVAIERAGSLKDFRWVLSPERMTELVADVMTKGDPHRGETVYRRQQLQCQKCHAIGGAGGLVGPDLISIGASAQVDYIIESLLEPNRKVKENYHTLTILTDQGKLVTGIPVRDGQDELVLRDAEGRVVTIPKATIEERAESRSLMPDGTIDGLTRAELVDLVRFLSELGKVGDFALSNRALIRNWETLLPTPEATQRLRRTSFDTAATNDLALTWQPISSRVSGELPLADLPAFALQASTPATSFVRFQVEKTSPEPLKFKLDSTAGLALWIDGKPTPCQQELEIDLPIGPHTLVFALDRTKADSLRIESLTKMN
jgi:putative heme-binding domain-containing protein